MHKCFAVRQSRNAVIVVLLKKNNRAQRDACVEEFPGFAAPGQAVTSPSRTFTPYRSHHETAAGWFQHGALLAEEIPYEEIIAKMTEDYEIDGQAARNELDRFLDHLKANKLLEE